VYLHPRKREPQSPARLKMNIDYQHRVTARLATHPVVRLAISATLLILFAGLAWAVDPCADTDECLSEGRCYMSNLETCETGDDACRYSYACLHEGMCAMDPATERCIAVSQRDCEMSMDCDDRGQCEFVPESRSCEVGAAACRDSAACADIGHCTLRDDRCVVGSSLDCEEARVCAEYGHCDFVGRGCAPTREEHCARATDCMRRGTCFLVDGAGVAHMSLDQGGACSHMGRCSDTEACTLHGNCTVGARNRCVPGGEMDCHRSAACADEGRCTFLPPPEPPETSEDGTMALMSSLMGPVGPACIVGGPEDCERACDGRTNCGYVSDFMGGGACDTMGAFEGVLTGFEIDDMFDHYLHDGLLYGRDDEGGGGGGSIGGGGFGGLGVIDTSSPPRTGETSEDADDEDDDGAE